MCMELLSINLPLRTERQCCPKASSIEETRNITQDNLMMNDDDGDDDDDMILYDII